MINEIIPNQMPTDTATQKELIQAADAWRFPYWDWAAHSTVPLLAKTPEIEVQTKFGTSKIKNPLYQYVLPKGKTFGTMGPDDNQTYVVTSADGSPVSTFPKMYQIPLIYAAQWELGMATGRCQPSFSENATEFQTGIVDNEQVFKNIEGHGWYAGTYTGSVKDAVYRLLTYKVDYETFATTKLNNNNPGPTDYLNCEFIHNNIHNWIGGDGGQMGDVPVAGFDPIFFLHHWYVRIMHWKVSIVKHLS